MYSSRLCCCIAHCFLRRACTFLFTDGRLTFRSKEIALKVALKFSIPNFTYVCLSFYLSFKQYDEPDKRKETLQSERA